MSKYTCARVCIGAVVGLLSIGTFFIVAQLNEAAAQIIKSPVAFIRSEFAFGAQPHEISSLPSVILIPQSDQFFAGDGSALSALKWGPAGGPFTSAFTTGNVANFAVANGTGTGGSITVGGI